MCEAARREVLAMRRITTTKKLRKLKGQSVRPKKY